MKASCSKCGAPTKKRKVCVQGKDIELDVFTCGASCPRHKAGRKAMAELRRVTRKQRPPNGAVCR